MRTTLPFNPGWYLQQNPDVALAIANGTLSDPLEHFMLYGRAEGRSGSPLFDAAYYRSQNADVAFAVTQGLFSSGWDHFEMYGGAEGRLPTPLLNTTFYLQQHPDVEQAIREGTIQSPAQHFILYGHKEARAISPAIDLSKYLNANPDIAISAAAGFTDAFSHLMQFGVSEGRNLGNGIHLSDFSNDPVFSSALANGNIIQALNRVEAVAPFLPSFERPAGWTPPANTPIPVDFVPPENSGLLLRVPPDITIPASLVLPPVFNQAPPEPAPTPAPEPTPAPPENATFTVTETGTAPNQALSFGGTATGDVTVTMTGSTLTFSRGGIEAIVKPIFANLANTTGIPKPGTSKLVMSDAVFTAISSKLPSDVSLKISDTTLSLYRLKTIEAATSGLVDATAVTETSGMEWDATQMLVTKNGTAGDAITMATNVAVSISVSGPTSAANLVAIDSKTTGNISISNLYNLTGTLNDIKNVINAATDTAPTQITLNANFNVTASDSTVTATLLNTIDNANGSGTIKTSNGGGNGAWSITGLSGTTISATASSDTFVFEAGHTNVTISNFTVGSDADQLDLKAIAPYISAATIVDGRIAATAPNTSGPVNLEATLNFISNQGDAVDTLTEVQALVTGSGANPGKWQLANGAQTIIFYGNVANGPQSFDVYHVTNKAGITWTKIATLGVNDGDGLVAANFIYSHYD